MSELPIGLTTASLAALGLEASSDLAAEGDRQGYESLWVAETTGFEAFTALSLIGSLSKRSALATGVVPLQIRTPMLTAMSALTVAAMNPGRDVLIGVGISSPAVVGRWHGARYLDRPIGQTREYLECLRHALGDDPFDYSGSFYQYRGARCHVRTDRSRVKLVLGALNPQMLALAGELADGVLLNYLPAGAVPGCIEHVRAGESRAGRPHGSCTVFAYVHAGLCDPDAALTFAQRDLWNYANAPAYRDAFAAAGFEAEMDAFKTALEARDREAQILAISPSMADAINHCGERSSIRSFVDSYRSAGVDVPVLMPLPWGRNRLETAVETIAALAPHAE